MDRRQFNRGLASIIIAPIVPKSDIDELFTTYYYVTDDDGVHISRVSFDGGNSAKKELLAHYYDKMYPGWHQAHQFDWVRKNYTGYFLLWGDWMAPIWEKTLVMYMDRDVYDAINYALERCKMAGIRCYSENFSETTYLCDDGLPV